MARMIKHAKQIQKKSRILQVRQIGPNWFKVTDPATRQQYDVNLGLNGGTCTCPWGQTRPANDHRSGCSHVVAAMEYRAEQRGRRVSVWSSEKAARRQHRPVINIGDGLVMTTRPD